MPESTQSSLPPPAYTNHGDVSVASNETPPTAPVNQPTTSISHEIIVDAAATIQEVDASLTIAAPDNPGFIAGSNTAESDKNHPNGLLSKLENVIQQLESSQEERLITRLENVLSRQAEANSSLLSEKKDTRNPIKLKDAVGRRFSFPYHRCETWAGISELIKAAFLHVEIIGPHVSEGHYDIMNPAGEVILPQLWQDHVQPGWEISMSMWPIPGPPKPRFPALTPNAPVHVIVDRVLAPAPNCFRSHHPPSYSSDLCAQGKGARGLWQKMKGIFTRKKMTYDSDSSESSCCD
ncbi:putative tpr repeat protein oca3 protein [Botrytis fragariae]|uniref:Putative tpr repeat protein oca3 protein n=1 Tax=Botrytis fragariae TaxID=1964551 RepID=A0A8H6B432_9HELO|nr:putative tpr repeat protein oca3 protein [Botrytis fragariae]KAF5879024.1 putative tpr repeat protein oca3 protein [Botrytis fragariae]